MKRPFCAASCGERIPESAYENRRGSLPLYCSKQCRKTAQMRKFRERKREAST